MRSPTATKKRKRYTDRFKQEAVRTVETRKRDRLRCDATRDAADLAEIVFARAFECQMERVDTR